jgi:hypothetical protein
MITSLIIAFIAYKLFSKKGYLKKATVESPVCNNSSHDKSASK